MNREILFRGKESNSGKWVYGYLWSKRTIGVTSPVGNVDEVVVDPATVGQYTGLTDKNGVKIFEGDILNENGYCFTVVYDARNAKFKLKYVHVIQYPEWNRGVLMEVIGNIYDNPELWGETHNGNHPSILRNPDAA